MDQIYIFTKTVFSCFLEKAKKNNLFKIFHIYVELNSESFLCFSLYWITKIIFILSFVSSGLEFSSVNDTLIYENSKLKVFKRFWVKFQTFDQRIYQGQMYKTSWILWINTTLAIFEQSKFWPFSSWVILPFVLSSNFMTSGIKNWR